MSGGDRAMHDDITTIIGVVADVFGHRFVIATKSGKVLADLGPKGAELIALREGDEVTLAGEMKPTELKVSTITRKGEAAIAVEHKKKPHEQDPAPHRKHDAEADPAIALKAARDAGYAVVGSPRRKPQHFEVLGRNARGGFVELHIEFDGDVRKRRPIESGDQKWEFAIASAIR
jgi:hypothetical protein